MKRSRRCSHASARPEARDGDRPTARRRGHRRHHRRTPSRPSASSSTATGSNRRPARPSRAGIRPTPATCRPVPGGHRGRRRAAVVRPRTRSAAGAGRRPRSAARSSTASASCSRRDKERLARAMTREMGKVLAEARGDVQEGIDIAFLMAGEGRRIIWRYSAVRTAGQVGDERPRADRRRRDHHALELPDGDSVLEDDAGARHAATPSSSSRPATRPTAPCSSWN